MAVIETTYQCTNQKCRATDHDRSPVGGIPPPVALNCYKCGRGRGKDLSEMLSIGLGMRPISQEEVN